MEKKIEEQKPKGEITTFAWVGMISIGQDENGDIWEWWRMRRSIKREPSKEEKG